MGEVHVTGPAGKRPADVTPTPTAVLFLDLDGTVREGIDDPLGRFVNTAEDVRVFPQAVTMMRRWREEHDRARIIGLTNQGGVALGYLTEDQMIGNMAETQRQCGDLFDSIMACVHHPAADEPVRARCYCRKPKIGLLVESLLRMGEIYAETYPPHLALMVGDLDSDEEMAAAAGIRFERAAAWRSKA